MKRLAGPVRRERRVGVSYHLASSFQLHLDRIISGAVRRAVQPKADNKDTPVDGKLNAVTSASVPPLIASVRAGHEPMTHLKRKPRYI